MGDMAAQDEIGLGHVWPGEDALDFTWLEYRRALWIIAARLSELSAAWPAATWGRKCAGESGRRIRWASVASHMGVFQWLKEISPLGVIAVIFSARRNAIVSSGGLGEKGVERKSPQCTI